MLSESIRQTMELYYDLRRIVTEKKIEESIIDINQKWLKNSNFVFSVYSDNNQNSSFPFSFSPFLICQKDSRVLSDICNKMTTILEKIIDKYVEGDKNLDEFFNVYRPFKPFFSKIAGKWLSIARYDFMIDQNYRLKFTEFNTSSPGLLLIWPETEKTLNTFICQNKIFSNKLILQPYSKPHSFENYLFNLEKCSNTNPGLIAFLYDTNKLQTELHEMKRRVEKLGRKAYVGSVEDLTYKNGKLYILNQEVSIIYNNFFLTGENLDLTKKSPWLMNTESFLNDHRYSALFHGIKNNSCVVVIGFPALTIIEDKNIFLLLNDKKFSYLFSDKEKLFIAKHIPKSVNLNSNNIINSYNKFIKNKNNLVLKLRTSGMGWGVYIGNQISDSEWVILLNKYLENAIIQEYINGIKFPAIVISKKEKLITNDMNVILSMYSYSGEYYGCVSRVSISKVTNLIRGFLQPVYEIKCE
ncbi:MAG TPA: hypothetical protein VG895_05655 [Patescibacteria group bacterium]|nr:hypothetical protein [Gammaproteobacteria bacterium]HWA52500.1 hypothetical protein [Patescibacteria group bacterium]